jgi:hypothetical protein
MNKNKETRCLECDKLIDECQCPERQADGSWLYTPLKEKTECACKGNEHFNFHSVEHCCVINKCYKDCHYVNKVEEKAERRKDTLKEWIDVFDLDLEDSKRMATLIDIIVKRVRKEEMDKFEQKLEEYRNSDEVWKNVGISKWKAEGERKGYFTFLNSTGKLNT